MDKNGLTDDQIVALCETKIADAVGWNSSKLSKERERVTDYYNSLLPKRIHAGSTSYVSPEVYIKVSQMRNQIVETFSGSDRLVSFDAFHPQDEMSARAQTEYCSHVLFKDNPGHAILRDVIHDGLMARVGVARVAWEKIEGEGEEYEFSNVTQDEMDALRQNPAFSDIQAAQDEYGIYSGRLVETKEGGRIVVGSVNPEEFFIEPQAKMLSPEYYCGTRTVKTLAWIETNYPGKTKGLESYNFEDDLALRNSPELIARFQGTDSGVSYNSPDATDAADPMTRPVLINELFIKIRREGDITPSLHRVVTCGKVMLECEKIARLPLIAFVPLPIPHAFYGDSFAARMIPFQDIATSTARQVLDHAAITNNPRLLVKTGSLKNPRELLENRLGGIVNVSSPDAIMPMPQTALNPYIFSLGQAMQAKSEEVTGISALSQGQNKDAVSQQNSAGLIEQLVNMGQVGQKQIARNFAEQFLIPLYEMISELVILNESEARQLQVTGQVITCDPAQWVAGRTCSASPHLGYGERDAKARKVVDFISRVKEGGGGKFMGDQGDYAVIEYLMSLDGERNLLQSFFPITPDKIQPAQPDPMMIAEVELKKAQAQAHVQDAQTNAKKVDVHAELAAAKQKLAEMQAMLDNKVKEEGEHRRNMESMNRIDISQREIHLTEQAPADMTKAIISPNG
ncbi:hypothetical protein ACFZ8E_07510 [Methylobacterium sp. HMF5984]|uniref:portal protein n=1 Tax=Methylobacterium sp. HMF5984 TaxID=3367370 RepID=UPI0038551CAC